MFSFSYVVLEMPVQVLTTPVRPDVNTGPV